MSETRRTNQIAVEVSRYYVVVLRMSETHWNQAGQKKIDWREMALYSVHEENAPHTQEVAVQRIPGST